VFCPFFVLGRQLPPSLFFLNWLFSPLARLFFPTSPSSAYARRFLAFRLFASLVHLSRGSVCRADVPCSATPPGKPVPARCPVFPLLKGFVDLRQPVVLTFPLCLRSFLPFLPPGLLLAFFPTLFPFPLLGLTPSFSGHCSPMKGRCVLSFPFSRSPLHVPHPSSFLPVF